MRVHSTKAILVDDCSTAQRERRASSIDDDWPVVPRWANERKCVHRTGRRASACYLSIGIDLSSARTIQIDINHRTQNIDSPFFFSLLAAHRKNNVCLSTPLADFHCTRRYFFPIKVCSDKYSKDNVLGHQYTISQLAFSILFSRLYLYMCVDPFMRVSSSQDVVRFFSSSASSSSSSYISSAYECMWMWMYARVCVSADRRITKELVWQRENWSRGKAAMQTETGTGYTQRRRIKHIDGQREREKSNLNLSLPPPFSFTRAVFFSFYGTKLNRAPRSLTMIYIKLLNKDR